MSIKHKKESKSGFPISRIVIMSLIGTLLFFAFAALFSFIVLKSSVSSSAYMPAGLLLGAISALISGFGSVRPVKEKGVLYGGLTGLFQALVCSVVLFIVNGGVAGTGIFILSAIIIIASAVGGIAAVNLKIKKKY